MDNGSHDKMYSEPHYFNQRLMDSFQYVEIKFFILL